MTPLYNSTNRIPLSNFIASYEIPAKYKAKAAHIFVKLFDYISQIYVDSKILKDKWTQAINVLTYIIFTDDSLPNNWNKDRPIENLPIVDQSDIKDVLKEYYLESSDCIIWDVAPIFSDEAVERIDEAVNNIHEARKHEARQNEHNIKVSGLNKPLANYRAVVSAQKPVPAPLKSQTDSQVNIESADKLTSMYDILLDPSYPYFPRVDFHNYWIVYKDDFGEEYGIPRSLPLIPERQSDITATTEINRMVESDFMKLYPNHIMKVRSQAMYTRYEDFPELDYDEDIGVIFPIEGFTKEQIVDNIIKYPDIINIGLGRVGRQKQWEGDQRPKVVWEEFFKRIEIDGQLYIVDQHIWDQLPELRKLPPNRAFQQEYVVRKYLLERDNGVYRDKQPFGTLYPFITLFMPPQEYIKRGYKDVLEIAKSCVKSRVSYFRSRNPMLNRLGLHFNYEGELIKE